MSKYRSTQSKVPKKRARTTTCRARNEPRPDHRVPRPDNHVPRPDNEPRPDHHEPFSPAAALESLHTEMVQLDAFAHLAGEVVTRLSPPKNRTERRNFVRLYAIVTKVAHDAIAAVRHGDALISVLSAHQAVRRSGPASAEPDPITR